MASVELTHCGCFSSPQSSVDPEIDVVCHHEGHLSLLISVGRRRSLPGRGSFIKQIHPFRTLCLDTATVQTTLILHHYSLILIGDEKLTLQLKPVDSYSNSQAARRRKSGNPSPHSLSYWQIFYGNAQSQVCQVCLGIEDDKRWLFGVFYWQ